jgi:hypothetical protein
MEISKSVIAGNEIENKVAIFKNYRKTAPEAPACSFSRIEVTASDNPRV